MIRASQFRRQEQENKIDRLVIHGVEVDWCFQSGKYTIKAVKAGNLAMRNGDPLAHACRAQTLALQQRLEYFSRRYPRKIGRHVGQFLQDLFLAARFQRRYDTIGADQIR